MAAGRAGTVTRFDAHATGRADAVNDLWKRDPKDHAGIVLPCGGRCFITLLQGTAEEEEALVGRVVAGVNALAGLKVKVVEPGAVLRLVLAADAALRKEVPRGWTDVAARLDLALAPFRAAAPADAAGHEPEGDDPC